MNKPLVQTEAETRVSAGEAILRSLKLNGVDKLFINPGRILLILILYFAYSSEYIFVKEDSPALITPDVGKSFSGSKVA